MGLLYNGCVWLVILLFLDSSHEKRRQGREDIKSKSLANQTNTSSISNKVQSAKFSGNNIRTHAAYKLSN